MKYQLVGDDMQAVIIGLESGESVRAEAGTMTYMTDSIEMESTAGTGGDLMSSLMSGAKRVIAGESFFIPTFTAQGEAGSVAFSAPYPGKIIPVDLKTSGTMLCQRSSFLCAEEDIQVSIAFTRKFGAGLFGGEGFVLQKLTGEGLTFIHAGGTVLPLDLKAGQSLRVDTGCLVAFQESVIYDIRMVKGIKNMFLGGEGLFLAHLTGPGRVYLQTLPFSKMAGRILGAAAGGKSGSPLDVVSMITG